MSVHAPNKWLPSKVCRRGVCEGEICHAVLRSHVSAYMGEEEVGSSHTKMAFYS